MLPARARSRGLGARTSRLVRRGWAGSLAIATWWALAAPVSAAAGPADRGAARSLQPSDDGRAKVRGDRPQRASIHAAWSPPANEPDRDDRDALAAFESTRLPATIVDV